MQALRLLAAILALASACVANARDWQALAEHKTFELPDFEFHRKVQ